MKSFGQGSHRIVQFPRFFRPTEVHSLPSMRLQTGVAIGIGVSIGVRVVTVRDGVVVVVVTVVVMIVVVVRVTIGTPIVLKRKATSGSR